MIKVKNESELMHLLKIVSSEAAGLSKKLFEGKDTEAYRMQYQADEKMYGDLSEQEEDAEQEEEVEEPQDNPKEQQPQEEEEQEPEAPEETGDVGASFDSVVQAVNNLRAGKSLRDSDIKQQAQDYYDKLSEAERTTLLVFLKAMSDIIAGQVDGKDAQDPSKPPVSLNITADEEDEPEAEAPEDQVEEPTPEPQQSDAEPAAEEEEDTSPPIRVNESQDVMLLRMKKIRRMMLRG
jgi:hypothetical protein